MEEKILRVLSEYSPLNYKEIAEFTGQNHQACFEVTRRLWDRKALHISHYERAKASSPMPYYSVGRGQDAERPSKKTQTESGRQWRAKFKKERPDEYAKWLKRNVDRQRKLIQSSPEVKERVRGYKLKWARKKFNQTPKDLLMKSTMSEIAMQLGNTWFLRKAA